MLGISVYFKDLDYDYLQECANLGVKFVFTSLHIPEEDYSNIRSQLPALIAKCHQFGLEIVPDISPVTFEKLAIKNQDFNQLKALGIKALRLDYGFDDVENLAKLMFDFKLFLNASVVSPMFIDECKQAGIDLQQVVFMHNFYPRIDTGLSDQAFRTKNKLLHQLGLRTQAFVCGDELKRFPLYEGLPTLEKHRSQHPYVAAVELLSEYKVTDIMIGDSKAKKETLNFIKTYIEDNVISLKVHLDDTYNYLYNQLYDYRQDGTEYTIRLSVPRSNNVEIYNNGVRRRGSITIDNRLMGRYSGEVQLLLEELPLDARVNVIGFIHPDFIDVIKYRKPQTKIKFVKM